MLFACSSRLSVCFFYITVFKKFCRNSCWLLQQECKNSVFLCLFVKMFHPKDCSITAKLVTRNIYCDKFYDISWASNWLYFLNYVETLIYNDTDTVHVELVEIICSSYKSIWYLSRRPSQTSFSWIFCVYLKIFISCLLFKIY